MLNGKYLLSILSNPVSFMAIPTASQRSSASTEKVLSYNSEDGVNSYFLLLLMWIIYFTIKISFSMITNYITSIDKFQAVSHYDTYLLFSVRMDIASPVKRKIAPIKQAMLPESNYAET